MELLAVEAPYLNLWTAREVPPSASQLLPWEVFLTGFPRVCLKLAQICSVRLLWTNPSLSPFTEIGSALWFKVFPPPSDCVCVSHSVMSLCDLINYSPPGSSVHGILQARILQWAAISFSEGSSWPRDRTHISCVSCIGRWILYHCTTWFHFYSPQALPLLFLLFPPPRMLVLQVPTRLTPSSSSHLCLHVTFLVKLPNSIKTAFCLHRPCSDPVIPFCL